MEKSLQKLTLTDRRKLEVGGVLESFPMMMRT